MFPQDLEIVDTHLHQWDPGHEFHPLRPLYKLFGRHPKFYGWLCNKVIPKALQQSLGDTRYMRHPYKPNDFQTDTQGFPVSTAVYLPYAWKAKTDLDYAFEASFAQQLFQEHDIDTQLGAIVGSAHLNNLDDLANLIESYRATSSKVVGLRDMLMWHDDPQLMSYASQPLLSKDPKWRQGFALLAKNNLLFEAGIYHTQLDELSELAGDFPETDMVLAHIGTPTGMMGPVGEQGANEQARTQIFEQWKAGIARLAQHKNVSVKISGLFLPSMGWGMHKGRTYTDEELLQRLQPVVDHVIDCFGSERCMFGSHCPPDKVSISYSRLYQLYYQLVRSRSQQQQVDLFSKTAKRVYKIQS